MTERKAYIGARIFDGTDEHFGAALVIEKNKILKIIPEEDVGPDCEVTLLHKGLICPGFVDIQVNGGGGYLLNEAPSLQILEKICDTHAKLGTTSLFPTLISDVPAVTKAAQNCAIEAYENDIPSFIGLNLEGPHLASSRSGAHDKSVIKPMDNSDYLNLETLAQKIPKVLITVAPEAVPIEYIEQLTAAGVIVSLGHSDCSFAQAQELANAGATGVTHLFNAKKSPGSIFLISDSMATTGTSLESFELNGRTIFRKNGRLTLANGTLAGADLDLASAVRFMVNKVGIPHIDALKMATILPSKFIGMEKELGVLKPGARADFLWLDNDLNVQRVWRSGEFLA